VRVPSLCTSRPHVQHAPFRTIGLLTERPESARTYPNAGSSSATEPLRAAAVAIARTTTSPAPRAAAPTGLPPCGWRR
jgi:hypothetical protein